MKKKTVTFQEPSQQQLNDLLKYYQTKQYDNAEKLAVSITKEFPKNQFSWKVLAAVLKQNGKINESLTVSQKSVKLDPNDAEAHKNLGILLQEQNRLKEAETSFKKAITDPEKVIAPTAAPIDISIKLANFILPGDPRLNAPGFKKAEIATNTAAKPTRL